MQRTKEKILADSVATTGRTRHVHTIKYIGTRNNQDYGNWVNHTDIIKQILIQIWITTVHMTENHVMIRQRYHILGFNLNSIFSESKFLHFLFIFSLFWNILPESYVLFQFFSNMFQFFSPMLSGTTVRVCLVILMY